MKKLTIEGLQRMVAEEVRRTISEARKKKSKKKKVKEAPKRPVRPNQYMDGGDALALHEPMGQRNRIRVQGASNIGPWTNESLRQLIARTIREQVRPGKKRR